MQQKFVIDDTPSMALKLSDWESMPHWFIIIVVVIIVNFVLRHYI